MDKISAQKRAWTMAQVRSSGNKSTEQKMIVVFKENKVKGWRRKYPLFGKPDFVFPKERVAVFVDGCFWHGHSKLCRMPENNNEYWIKKIEGNKKRDKKVNQELKKKHWKVLRIWEHKIESKKTIDKLKSCLIMS
ncbi:MAG: DNA mismatch endonuclease Vsr [Deltaproteobacteria bacterium]|nr:DNA mismatch endonuclease Vsr [Deltaproteobacteria bacterium]